LNGGLDDNGGTMDIETKNANLDTLAVTIMALHVAGKQMTLAVFRQLPMTSLVYDTGEKIEYMNWWGLVRYNIKDECDLWVVVETGGILYRSALKKSRLKYLTETINQFDNDFSKTKMITNVRINNRFYNHIEDAKNEYKRLLNDYKFYLNYELVFNEANELPQLFIAV
jgi:hypothetical protein